jgi:hypothetical protein
MVAPLLTPGLAPALAQETRNRIRTQASSGRKVPR